ncbi:hypothetical protein BJ165DRAFT_1410374 [Panaeolus papilionaceus]|nr:hypothetical protein BJ165DRAFT_1410374 [Panaeolus papilionaceus]
MRCSMLCSCVSAILALLALSFALNVATKSLSSFTSALCSLPLMSAFCPQPQDLSKDAIWSVAFCKAFPFAQRCSTHVDDTHVRPPNVSAPVVDIRGAMERQFREANALMETSYRFTDTLSHEIHQILLGVNKANAHIKQTDLPPNIKATAFQSLVDVRLAARETNACVQAYLAKMHTGVTYVTASIGYATRQLQIMDNSATSLAKTGSNREAFSNAMNTFQTFSRSLLEKNDLCQASILRLESKLDYTANTFLDDAFAAAKKDLDETRARFWLMFGKGKAASQRAEENINRIDVVGMGLESLSASAVLLNLHFEQLRAGAIELMDQSQQWSEGNLPVEEIVALLLELSRLGFGLCRSCTSLVAAMTFTLSCRKRTQRLQDYPWRTHFLLDIPDFSSDLVSDSPDSSLPSSFLRNLSQFEQRFFSTPNYIGMDPQLADLREALAYVRETGSEGDYNWPSTKDHRRYGKLCSALTSYKIAEIFLQTIGSPVPHVRTDVVPKSWLTGHNTALMKPWKQLENLETLIGNFVGIFSQRRAPLINGPTDTKIYHMHNIARCNSNMVANNIAFNFSIAAAHAYYLATQDFDGRLPELPDNVSDFIQGISQISDSSTLSASDIQSLKNLAADTEINSLRCALELATHTTPLALLLPKDLGKTTPFSRVFILEAAKALGNKTLPSVQLLENLTWTALLKIVNGKDSVDAVLHQLASQFSEHLPTCALDLHFKEWFILKEPTSSKETQGGSALLAVSTDGKEISSPQSSTNITFSPLPLQCTQVGDDTSAFLQAKSQPSLEPTNENLRFTMSSPHRDSSNNLGGVLAIQVGSGGQTMDTQDIGIEGDKPDIEKDSSDEPESVVMQVDGPSLPHDLIGNETHGNHQASDERENEASEDEDARDAVQDGEQEGEGKYGERDGMHDQESEKEAAEINEEADEREGGEMHDDESESAGNGMDDDESGGNESDVQDLMDVDPRLALSSKKPNAMSGGRKPKRKRSTSSRVPSTTRSRTSTQTGPSKKARLLSNSPPLKTGTTPGFDLAQPEAFYVNDETDDVSIPIFTSEGTERHFATRVYQLYGPTAPSPYCPSAHFKTEVAHQEALFQAVEQHYKDGLPLHISNPDESFFRIMACAEYDLLTPLQVQTILQKQCIAIPDFTSQRYQFDETGLRSLAPLGRKTTIQDQSKKPGKKGYNDRRRLGSLRNFIEEAAKYPDGKILNGLYFPGEKLGDDNPFSSELFAWRLTESRRDCANDGERPVSALRWGLVATTGARHGWHVDCNGLATFIDFHGTKFWCIASGADLSSIKTFTTKAFSIDDPSPHLGTIEGLLCHAGMRLIMRPADLHSIVTIEHAICHGGHYYSLHLMHRTLQAMVHILMVGGIVTNNNHPQCTVLLRRMLAFVHETMVRSKHQNNRIIDEPYVHDHSLDLTKFYDFINFLALINIHIFGDILVPSSYEQPCPVNADELRHTMHFRGMALNMLIWFARRYKVTDSTTQRELDALHDVALPHLARQGRTLIQYKRRSSTKASDVHFTHSKLEERLSDIFASHPMTARAWSSASLAESLDWPLDYAITITKRSTILSGDKDGDLNPISNYVEAGTPLSIRRAQDNWTSKTEVKT